MHFETNIADSKGKDLTWQAIIDSGGKSAYSNTINAPMPKHSRKTQKEEPGSHWFLYTLLALLGVGLIGGLVWFLFLREKPQPEPVMEAPAPAPVAAAPPPVAKTMAIDIGADNKSPVVGWIRRHQRQGAGQDLQAQGAAQPHRHRRRLRHQDRRSVRVHAPLRGALRVRRLQDRRFSARPTASW